MLSALKQENLVAEADALRLAGELAAEVEEPLEHDEIDEAFNTLVHFAKRHEFTAVEVGSLLAILRRRSGLPVKLITAWSKDGPKALGEQVDTEREFADRLIGLELQAHPSRTDWSLAELHAEACEWFHVLNSKLFNGALPPAPISIAPSRGVSLGWYQVNRDGLGLRHRINLNLLHVHESRSQRIAVLAHEAVHLWEDVVHGRRKGGSYHTKKFLEKAEQIGIPTTEKGEYLGIVAGGQLAQLLAEHGIALHEAGKTSDEIERIIAARRQPALQAWLCACTKIYASRSVSVDGVCGKCGRKWQRHV